MRVDLLKNIVTSVVGTPGSAIVDLLHSKKNVNEFLIAKKLNLTINQTRNILYRLADEGLVSFIRKKDTKKGGWYTYFWTLSSGKSLMKFREKLIGHLDEAKSEVARRTSVRFFRCDICDKEYTEEEALANTYLCPECGEVLVLSDNKDKLAEQNQEIERLDALLKEVDSELEILNAKMMKARERALAAELKARKEKRKNSRLKNAKLAGKTAKKKVVKKKAKKVAKKKVKKAKVKKKVVKKKVKKKVRSKSKSPSKKKRR